jgi:hypothetical protein
MPSDTGAHGTVQATVDTVLSEEISSGVGRQVKCDGGWLRSALDMGGKRCRDRDRSCAGGLSGAKVRNGLKNISPTVG